MATMFLLEGEPEMVVARFILLGIGLVLMALLAVGLITLN